MFLTSCGDILHFPWLRFKLTAVGPTKPNYEGLRLANGAVWGHFPSPWAHKYLNNARNLAELASTDPGQRTAQPARTPEGQAANKREMHFSSVRALCSLRIYWGVRT